MSSEMTKFFHLHVIFFYLLCVCGRFTASHKYSKPYTSSISSPVHFHAGIFWASTAVKAQCVCALEYALEFKREQSQALKHRKIDINPT